MDFSTIKKFFYKFIIASLIFYLIAQNVEGVQTSDQMSHWIMMFMVFFAGLSLIKPVLNFLTLPNNFLFNWLIGGILCFGSLYAMKMLFPGIQFGQTTIDGKSLGIVSINPTTLDPMLTMILTGIYGSFVNALLYWLKKD